jgi:hypothetical protein
LSTRFKSTNVDLSLITQKHIQFMYTLQLIIKTKWDNVMITNATVTKYHFEIITTKYKYVYLYQHFEFQCAVVFVYLFNVQLLTSVPLNMMWYSPTDGILTVAKYKKCDLVHVQHLPGLLKHGKKDTRVKRATVKQLGEPWAYKSNSSLYSSIRCKYYSKVMIF